MHAEAHDSGGTFRELLTLHHPRPNRAARAGTASIKTGNKYLIRGRVGGAVSVDVRATDSRRTGEN